MSCKSCELLANNTLLFISVFNHLKMGPKAKASKANNGKNGKAKNSQSKKASAVIKYTPITDIKVDKNAHIVRTIEEYASILEKEGDKRFFFYRNIALQVAMKDVEINGGYSSGFSGKAAIAICEIMEYGTLKALEEKKQVEEEASQPGHSSESPKFVAEMGKQVAEILEDFIGACNNWTGGDDGLYFTSRLDCKNPLVQGTSHTSPCLEFEMLVIQRTDGKPFTATLKQHMEPYLVDAKNAMIEASNQWTKMSGYHERPIIKKYLDEIKLVLNPTVNGDAGNKYGHFAKPGEFLPDEVIANGTLGCAIEPGCYGESAYKYRSFGRWDYRLIKRAKQGVRWCKEAVAEYQKEFAAIETKPKHKRLLALIKKK